MSTLADVVNLQPHERAAELVKILLIDLENCPSQINDLLSKLGSYSQIVVCYAQSGAKVPLDWLMPLSAAITSQRLKIIKMAHVGKNSADFGICFFAGVLMQQFPPDADFTILSDDTDLEHVVRLLAGEGRQASRIGGKKEDKPVPTAVNVVTGAAAGAQTAAPRTMATFCAMLLAHPNNRPGKEDALRNALRSHFMQSVSLAEHIFKQLVQGGALGLTDGKIRYVDARLKALSIGT
jgi:PIN domain